MPSAPSKIAALSFCAALCIGGAVGLAKEYPSFLLGQLGFEAHAERMARGTEPALPASRIGLRSRMLFCIEAQTSFRAMLLSDEIRTALPEACLADARAATAKIASYSEGYLVQALAWAALKRPDEAAEALIRSQQTGPEMGWLADTRLRLGAELLALGQSESDVMEVVRRDVAILSPSQQGQIALAQIYLGTPDFKPVLLKALEDRPALEQRRFLARVRSILRESGT